MNKHYAGLDGVRGFAAGAVMLMHEIGIFRPGIGPQINAGVAVDLFFILSGFVLACAYDHRLEKGMGGRLFMAIRIIRLYPMLLLAMTLSSCVAILKLLVQHVSDPGESLLLIPAGLLLLPTGLFIGHIGAFSSQADLIPFGGPAWSLLFELIASAAFATRLRRPNRSGSMLFVIGALILIGLTFAAGRIGLLGTQGYVGVPGGFVRVGVSFAIGVLLFRWRVTDALRNYPAGLGVLAGGLLCMLPINSIPLFDLICVFLLFPLVICVAAQPIRSVWFRKACDLSGALSYPLYLLHVPVSRIVGFVAKAIAPSIGPNALIAMAMIASIVASFLALYFFDEPVRRWLTMRLRQHTPMAPTPPIAGELPFEHKG